MLDKPFRAPKEQHAGVPVDVRSGALPAQWTKGRWPFAEGEPDKGHRVVARKRLAHPAKKAPELINRERVGFLKGVRRVLTGVERFDRCHRVVQEVEFELGACHHDAKDREVRVHRERLVAPTGDVSGAGVAPFGEIARSHRLDEEVGQRTLE